MLLEDMMLVSETILYATTGARFYPHGEYQQGLVIYNALSTWR